jgi:nucleotide-binding universal stress UspA family protein
MPETPVKLLLPYDDSPSAKRAVELLAGYRGEAAALGATVLNVQARPVVFWPEGALDVGVVEASLIEQGRKHVGVACERLAAAGLQAQGEVRLGFAADSIKREAAALDAAAIVMGTRGSGPLRGFALGSVALRVAQSGAAPTLLVKEESRLPASLGKKLKVLLATDGSEPAVRAAEALVAWKAWLGELDVQIAHVQEPLTVLEAVLPPHDDVVGQWTRAEGERAARAARAMFDRAGIAHHLHLTAGEEPPLEIASLADETQCELIVLGTRGRGAAHHALIGSVAMKVAAQSPIPVLLVP